MLRLIRLYPQLNSDSEKGLSTDLALQGLVTPIYDAFGKDELAMAVFLDLSNAFDSLAD